MKVALACTAIAGLGLAYVARRRHRKLLLQVNHREARTTTPQLLADASDAADRDKNKPEQAVKSSSTYDICLSIATALAGHDHHLGVEMKPVVVRSRVKSHARSYCASHGPLFLLSSPSWGQHLLSGIYPSHGALRSVRNEPFKLHVWAHWPTTVARAAAHDGPCSLVVRKGGIAIARKVTPTVPKAWEAPILLTLDTAVSEESTGLVAELRCGNEGQVVRHLHIPPLEPLRIRVDGLLLVRGYSPRESAPPPLLFPDTAAAPQLPLRGFGVEMELITLIPEGPDGAPWESDAWDQRSHLDELWASVLAGCRDADAQSRCAKWSWTHDDSLQGVPAHVVSIMREALEAWVPSSAGLSSEQAARVERVLTNGQGTHRSEFKSPTPPHELSFAEDGEAQLRAIVRLLETLPAVAATPFGENGLSGTSLHVHVNVCNPRAAGRCLSAREVLAVWIAWVRYEMVTAQLARPWMRRSPSCVPLFATGPEIAAGPSHAAGTAWEEPQSKVAGADVPAFLDRAQRLLRREGFEALPVQEQLRHLFARNQDSAASALGRYCSLNLMPICQYGTIEIRRFHGTLNANTLCCWSAFCVSFVERFLSSMDAVKAVFDAPLAQGLAALNEAQEGATLQQLEAEMSSHLHPGVIGHLGWLHA